MTQKADWAQYWAERGFHVFPVAPRGKTPIPKNWPNAATCDPARVAEWWSAHPEANIGACPGASGCVVIDVDAKTVDGFASLSALSERLGPLPETMTTRTPTGGAHLWLALPGSCPNSASALAAAIDVKGVAGYVLMPGSTVEAGEYTHDGEEIAPMPERWALAVRAPAAKHEARESTGAELDLPESLARARRYLADLISTGDVAIAGNGGNNRTFKLAASLRDMGLSEETAIDEAAEWNEACAPPWGADEFAGIFSHAYKYAQNEAGAKAHADGGAGFEALAAPPPEPAKQSRFRSLSIGEMRDLPEPQWLAHGYIPAYSTVLLYGAPGSLKSFVALDLAMSLAAGVPAWGLESSIKPVPAVYLAGEGQIGIGKQRVPAWLQHRGAKAGIPFRLVPDVPRAADAKAELTALFAAIEESGELPRLVVIDTHSRVMSGLDENSTQDTSKALDLYAAISKRYSATVVAVHHADKSGANERGSTALRGGVDAVFRVDYDRAIRRAVLKCDNKMKDAEEPESICFSPSSVGDSLVLERKQPVVKERAESQLHYDIVRVLTAAGAHSIGSALTTKALACSLPEITAIDNQAERDAAIARTVAALDKAKRRELRSLLAPPPHSTLWMLPPLSPE